MVPPLDQVVEVQREAVLKGLEVVLDMKEVLNGVRCVLWVLAVMLCMLFRVLLCILEAVEGWLRLVEESEVPEVMRCALLRMLEAVEGVRCVLEDVGGAEGAGGDALCGTLYTGRCRGSSVCWQ